jgi:hypothetical protein
VAHLEEDLWYYSGDIHNTPKPGAGKKHKREYKEGENKRAKTQSAAKIKRPWLQGKLEDGDSKALYSRKLAPKNRSKEPFNCKFVNILTIDFNPSLVDATKREVVGSSSSLYGSTSDDSV